MLTIFVMHNSPQLILKECSSLLDFIKTLTVHADQQILSTRLWLDGGSQMVQETVNYQLPETEEHK